MVKSPEITCVCVIAFVWLVDLSLWQMSLANLPKDD